MPRTEGVRRTLQTVGKARDALLFPQIGKRVPAPGENLVGIALVADVEEKAVVLVEDVEHGHRQLDGAQIGREMAAVFAHNVENVLPKFLRQYLKLLDITLFEVAPAADGL